MTTRTMNPHAGSWCAACGLRSTVDVTPIEWLPGYHVTIATMTHAEADWVPMRSRHALTLRGARRIARRWHRLAVATCETHD